MVKIAYHPCFAHNLPEGHRFPMLKYELIPLQLLHEGVVSKENFFEPDRLEEEFVLLAHQAAYWKQLKALSLPPKEQRRIGFELNEALLERELRIARGTIDGAESALEHGIAFNVAGGTHHAGSDWGEGFCLLNDQAIAASYLLSRRLAKRVLIIDLDVHQGNGTAEILAQEKRVFTFSMHGEKNFPFRKEISDCDIGLEDGVGDDFYLSTLAKALPELISLHRPDFIFYLSGVDVLETDRLGKLALSQAGCRERDRLVFEACVKYGLPVQVSMGGGYSPQIRDIVDAHCHTFKTGIALLGD